MLHIPCATSRFPSSTVLPRLISCTPDDLAAALFTTGRAPGDQLSYGLSSVAEFVHRAALLPAYLRRDGGGRVVRSALFSSLDRSEKVNLSYMLGQSLAGVFAEKALGVRHLLHVDRYQSHHAVSFRAGRRRPDLFGQASDGSWVVVEAKGRSNDADRKLRDHIGEQKRMIKTINGSAPLACGTIAKFPPALGFLHLEAIDPPDHEVEAVEVEVERPRFLEAYYAPFRLLFETFPSELRDGVRTVSFPGARVDVGLHESINERLGSAEGIRGIDAALETLAIDDLRRDGSRFSVDWAGDFQLPDRGE